MSGSSTIGAAGGAAKPVSKLNIKVLVGAGDEIGRALLPVIVLGRMLAEAFGAQWDAYADRVPLPWV